MADTSSKYNHSLLHVTLLLCSFVPGVATSKNSGGWTFINTGVEKVGSLMGSFITASSFTGVRTAYFLFIALGIIGIILSLWAGRQVYHYATDKMVETIEERHRLYNPSYTYGSAGSGEMIESNSPQKETLNA